MKRLFINLIVACSTFCFVGSSLYANYVQAQAAKAKGDFVSSSALFYKSYVFPKNKSEKVKSEFGLAESLHKLGLLYSASKYYSGIVSRGPNGNPFYRSALDGLGDINSTVNLGQAHIVKLLKKDVNSAYIPNSARGFYFYYQGVEAYTADKYAQAAKNFTKVPSGSPYFYKAMFHMGVIANLSGRQSKALSYFERVLSAGSISREMREAAILNIARVYYESRQYEKAIRYYGKIPRDSDSWLEALWEASWAFFLIKKHNNTLGNIHTIHSPFFINRFFPETYILQAITFLKLCMYDEVKASLRGSRDRYKPVFAELKSLLSKYKGRPKDFFKLLYDYKTGQLNSYKNVASILDNLSRTDAYKEAMDTIRFSDKELARLSTFSNKWKTTGIYKEVKGFLNSKKSLARKDAGTRLYKVARSQYSYLDELSGQTAMIQAEMLEGKINVLRGRANIKQASSKTKFVGGMQELSVGMNLEYWPFEGEYWEDELGGYVYNVESKCKAEKQVR